MHSMNIEGIEVYAGVDAPFIQEPEKIEPPQCKQNYDEKGAYIPPQCAKEYDVFSVPVKNAVQYMIETCRASENTEIVAIGALTNIAAGVAHCARYYPQAPSYDNGRLFEKALVKR